MKIVDIQYNRYNEEFIIFDNGKVINSNQFGIIGKPEIGLEVCKGAVDNCYYIIPNDNTIEKPCLCYYPCKNSNCPKESNSVCNINHCEIVDKYSTLTYHKNFCSECGRDLRINKIQL